MPFTSCMTNSVQPESATATLTSNNTSAATSSRFRIGIDGRYQGQPLTGVPRYIHELSLELDRQLPDAEFLLYAQKPDGITLPSSRWTLRCEPNPRYATLKPNLWLKLRLGQLLRADRPDVFWAAAGLRAGLAGNVPQVLTVHDFTFRLHPETMSRANLWAHRLFLARDLRRAHRVLTNSEGTRRRMIAYYGRHADAVIRPDASARFQPSSPAERAGVCCRYGLEAPFVLAVSTLEPRKNFVALIEAFLQLKRAGQLSAHELVLIGRKGWRDTRLSQQIAEHEGRSIRSLGFVPDDDLPALYSACDVFCMPSLYEGFGMPVLEARRCGARVVATDLEELREAGGDEARYCLPDAASIAIAIRDVISLPPPFPLPYADGWRRAATMLATKLQPSTELL